MCVLGRTEASAIDLVASARRVAAGRLHKPCLAVRAGRGAAVRSACRDGVVLLVRAERVHDGWALRRGHG